MEIYELSEIPESVLDQAGGKAKGLSVLSKAGFNIGRGFVLIGIESDEDLEKAAEHYIKSALGSVAVRSSATTEDSPELSNAGQFNTFLSVSGKDKVKDAIAKCIDSLNNSTASSYAAYFNRQKGAKMAVIIQEMVQAEKAGVCFTIDPVMGNNYMLIEAVSGMGEKLVSGSVPAKQYRIPFAEPGSDNITNSASFSTDSEDGLLDAKELRTIFSQAGMASMQLGMPLDLEWAIDANGKLFWLQARPITVIDEPDMDELDTGLDMSGNVITNCNIREMLPGAVTPLSLSTSVNAIDFGMRKMFVYTGAFRSMDEVLPGSCVLSVCNHLFINLTTTYKMADCVLGASSEAVDLSLCGRVLDDIPKRAKKKVNIFLKANNGRKYFTLLMSKNKARKEIQELADNFQIQLEYNPAQLYQEIDVKLAALNHSFWLHYITSGHSGAMAGALFMIIDAGSTDSEKTKSLVSSVLEDIEDIESVDILRSLRKLARAILAANPSAAGFSASEILDIVRNSKGDTGKAYECFIQRHGHRAIREAELRSGSWSRNEEDLMDYLKPVLVSGGTDEQKENHYIDNITNLLGDYKGFKKSILKYMIAQARVGVKNREFSKSMCIKVLDKFKAAYACLGNQLVLQGILPDADLIYFLQHNEIGQLIKEKHPALVRKALARRRMLARQQELKFCDVSIGKPKPAAPDIGRASAGTVLKGSPGSRGFAEGRARVVRSVDDAKMLQKGEIMIAEFTDIGWSPYYCLINALVTEVGSMLSHGVVVAREYALPLAVNVAGATQLIKTGDRVQVDGTSGTVTIVGQYN
jgi:phosphoenolpyruvate synthase/pyruvate phosphate dikinase